MGRLVGAVVPGDFNHWYWSIGLTSHTLKKAIIAFVILAGTLFLMGSGGCGGPPQAPDSPGKPKLVWSHDGEYIIFSPQYLGVFVVDSEGTQLWTIPENTPVGSGSYPGNFGPALSPDGTRLAYVTFWEYGNAEIMTAALDGTDVQRLTHADALDTNPTWSPDGSKIAFITGNYWEAQLAVMDADGSNEWLLAPSVNLEGHPSGQSPAWSPDGSWIAFVGREGDYDKGYRYVLHTVRPDGSKLTRLGELAGASAWSWSPKVSHIAFLGADDDMETRDNYRGFLYTISPDASDFSFLAEAEGIPVWSPDGAWLAFSQSNSEGPATYIVRADGRDLRQVIQGHSGPISWAADGSELYLAGLAYAVRFDGQGLRQLFPYGVHDPSAWSPDSSQLAVLLDSSRGGYESARVISEVLTLSEPNAHEPVKRTLVRGYGDRLFTEAEHALWGDIPRNIEACAEGFIVPQPEQNPGLVQDCKTLLAIRDTLAGAFYYNWSSALHIAEWDGVGLGGSPQRVESLRLASEGGSIPPEAGALTNLNEIILISGFHGRIPSEIGNLVNLRVLHSVNNYFDGSIPPELGNLTELRQLVLSGTRLSGSIPPELGNLTKLEELNLSWSEISGPLPPELGGLSSLKKLDLRNTDVSGNIPAEFGNLVNLRFLDLTVTELSGGIPPVVGNLVSLEELRLASTGIGGSLPPELGKLVNLKILDLGSNGLSGHIPTELGNLTKLERLNLSFNSLSGRIPAELGNLVRLHGLELHSNGLVGSIPPELGKLVNASYIYLNDNKLTGTIPEELGNLKNIFGFLHLRGNDLSGCIPRKVLPRLYGDYLQREGFEVCE